MSCHTYPCPNVVQGCRRELWSLYNKNDREDTESQWQDDISSGNLKNIAETGGNIAWEFMSLEGAVYV